MSAVKKRKAADRDLVVGLGATGLSIARYLRRAGEDAKFVDSRDEPPGMEQLDELWPDADVAPFEDQRLACGDAASGVDRSGEITLVYAVDL